MFYIIYLLLLKFGYKTSFPVHDLMQFNRNLNGLISIARIAVSMNEFLTTHVN